MPDIKIIKLKIRRGTDAQRKTVVLEQGELGYSTDTKRVFVGDGAILGGNIFANIVHAPLDTIGSRIGLTNAVKGDLVYENNLLYQLSGTNYNSLSSWGFIGTVPDESTLTYSSNKLIIKNNGITGNKFASSATYQYGGLKVHPTLGLSANVDNSTLYVTNTNTLSVKEIDQKHIASSTFSYGIQGGSGTLIALDVDTNYFSFNTNTLTLCAIPNNSVTFNSLDPAIFGTGLQISGSTVQSVLQDVDNTTINKSLGIVSLAPIFGTGGSSGFSNIEYNRYGQIVSLSSTITETLSCSQSSTSRLSVFNGELFQDTYTNQTIIPVISSSSGGSTVTIQLTSAGYIFLETGYYGRIAIPVLEY